MKSKKDKPKKINQSIDVTNANYVTGILYDADKWRLISHKGESLSEWDIKATDIKQYYVLVGKEFDKTFEEQKKALEGRAIALRAASLKSPTAFSENAWADSIEHSTHEHDVRVPEGELLSKFINVLEARIKELENKIETINNEILNEYNAQIKALSKDNALYKEYFYNLTLTDSEEKIQYIPVDIYIDTNDTQEIYKVYEATIDFLKIIDFESSIEFDAVKGSWYKKIVAKSKKALTSEEVTSRLKEAEYALEVNILKQQSEVDKNQSEALLNIIKSVENIPNAAIRVGALLVVKVTSPTGETNIQVRTLSIQELHFVNKNPQLLLSPQNILTAISENIASNDNGQLPINNNISS